MPRDALVTYAQVSSAANTLQTNGIKPTARAVREQLGNVGSMQTVLKHLQEWKTSQLRQREPGQGLPEPVQKAFLDYLDSRLTDARATLTAELADQRTETEGLAEENDRLALALEERAKAMDLLALEKAGAEGQVVQLRTELDRLREEVMTTRLAAEQARIDLAKADLRLEVTLHLESELAACRQLYEGERQARVVAEQAAAVLAAQKTDLENRLAERGASEPATATPVRRREKTTS